MSIKEQDIVLRQAESGDVEVVSQLWMDLMQEHEALDLRFVLSDDAMLRWKNDYPLWVDDRTRKIILAEKGGQVIGFVQAHRRLEPPVFQEKPEVFIDELYVLPSSRSQGVGALLLGEVKKWAAQVGGERIRLRVLAANKPGISFWEREGAKSIDVTYTIELESARPDKKKTDSRKLGF